MTKQELVDTVTQYLQYLTRVSRRIEFEEEVLDVLNTYIKVLETLKYNATVPKDQKKDYPVRSTEFEELMDDIIALDQSGLLWEAIEEANGLPDATSWIMPFKSINSLLTQVSRQTFFTRAARQIIKERPMSNLTLSPLYSKLSDKLIQYLQGHTKNDHWLDDITALGINNWDVEYEPMLNVLAEMVQDIRTTGKLKETYKLTVMHIPHKIQDIRDILDQWIEAIESELSWGDDFDVEDALREQNELLIEIRDLLLILDPTTDQGTMQALKDQYAV